MPRAICTSSTARRITCGRRGENISSFEVETGLRAHPAVEDVAVHAVFSEAGGG